MSGRTLGIVGASGFIGRELAGQAAREGWRVVGYSRSPRAGDDTISGWREWSGGPEVDLRGLEALVNLAGHPIDRRWTAENRRLFRESRVGVTAALSAALRGLPAGARPRVWINGTAVGIYGDRGDEILEETAAPGAGYLAGLCCDWEAAAADSPVRTIQLRTGMVLGREGAAFGKMRRIFKLGLGGRLGSGRQWQPWIHVQDLAGAILHGIGHPTLAGPVNGSAPEPERNAELTRKLARALRRPAWFPAPPFALRLLLGDFAGAVLASERAVPRALLESGFRFRFPELGRALEELV